MADRSQALRWHRPGLLRLAHDVADAVVLMARLRIQRPRASQGARSGRLRQTPGARSGTRGQDLAACAHPPRRTPSGRAIGCRAGAAAGRATRASDGVLVRRRSRPRLSWSTHYLQCLRGAPAPPAMPATTDYWINDRAGDPLLLITGDINAALTTAFPNLLREVRGAVGKRRVTIVFDRGGWSPNDSPRSGTASTSSPIARAKAVSSTNGALSIAAPGSTDAECAMSCMISRCASSRASCA